MLQDGIAIGVSLLAAAWLVRFFWKSLFSSRCPSSSSGPPERDGFVPLDALSKKPD
ncbi:MAG: hypothetical protein ABGW78_16515 [Pirellulales bacterium]